MSYSTRIIIENYMVFFGVNKFQNNIANETHLQIIIWNFHVICDYLNIQCPTFHIFCVNFFYFTGIVLSHTWWHKTLSYVDRRQKSMTLSTWQNKQEKKINMLKEYIQCWCGKKKKKPSVVWKVVEINIWRICRFYRGEHTNFYRTCSLKMIKRFHSICIVNIIFFSFVFYCNLHFQFYNV